MKITKPVILAFHMENEELEKLRAAAASIRVAVQPVPDLQANAPVGMLAGAGTSLLSGMGGLSAGMGGGLSESMIVMAGLSNHQLDTILKSLRKAHSKIALKAVLTPTNASWSGTQLQFELKKERASINSDVHRRF